MQIILDIPDFFRHDYNQIKLARDSPFINVKYKTNFVSIIRFKYYSQFWKNPVNKDLFENSLDILMKIFSDLYVSNEVFICDTKLNVFNNISTKQSFLQSLKFFFEDPSNLGIFYFREDRLIIMVNYDLSIVLFYDSLNKMIKNNIVKFQKNDLEFLI